MEEKEAQRSFRLIAAAAGVVTLFASAASIFSFDYEIAIALLGGLVGAVSVLVIGRILKRL